MTASSHGQRVVSPGQGVVIGAPRWRLGLEGLVLLAGALIAYGILGQPWWLVPTGILVTALALVWLAHIGMDRLLGMGLKFGDHFTRTHLGDHPDTR